MVRFISILALFGVFTVNAASLPDTLVYCDSRFFGELYKQRDMLKKAAPINQDNHNHAWFVPAKDGEEILRFSQPIKIQKLTFLGYYQSYSDLKKYGQYYYWGFIIDESPEAVVAAMPKAGWQQAGDTYMAMPMIKNMDDKSWKKNITAVNGIAPAKGSVEKVAIVEASQGKTLLVCTVQGNVTDELLLPLRPDLVGKR